jgi:hypothetical protein
MSAELENSPFTIQYRGDKWVVLITLKGVVQQEVVCATEADARALADARPLHALYSANGCCAMDRLQCCIDALKRHGLGEVLVARHLSQFANRISESMEILKLPIAEVQRRIEAELQENPR